MRISIRNRRQLQNPRESAKSQVTRAKGRPRLAGGTQHLAFGSWLLALSLRRLLPEQPADRIFVFLALAEHQHVRGIGPGQRERAGQVAILGRRWKEFR